MRFFYWINTVKMGRESIMDGNFFFSTRGKFRVRREVENRVVVSGG